MPHRIVYLRSFFSRKNKKECGKHERSNVIICHRVYSMMPKKCCSRLRHKITLILKCAAPTYCLFETPPECLAWSRVCSSSTSVNQRWLSSWWAGASLLPRSTHTSSALENIAGEREQRCGFSRLQLLRCVSLFICILPFIT